MLDIRTVLVSNLLIGLTLVVVLGLVWQSLHQRFAGMTFWLASFVLQVIGMFFVLLRGLAPDWLSVILGNLCLVVAMSLVCNGLALFMGWPVQKRWFRLAWVFYTGLMVYFTYFQPNVAVRIVCTSAAILLFTGRYGWMSIFHASPDLQRLTRGTGVVLFAIAVVQASRMVVAITLPVPSDFLNANSFDVLLLLFSQVLIIALAFAIILLSNGRLILETQKNESLLEHQAQLLRQRENQIEQYADTLEVQVAQRTHQLEEAQAQLILQEKLAVLGRLANAVGHELRNPLGNIHNAVYLLNLVQPNADERVKEYLELIKHEAHSADKIVTDLLDFARVKSCDPGPVVVAELIQETLERCPAPGGVQISQMFAPDLPRIYADSRHIVQVLSNLVINAYQAMPKGGALMIRSQSIIRDIPGSDAQGEVCIEIEDTGKGILPENLPRLFEPLFTTKAKGVGLGLAVAQKLVQANGGTIEVQSEPGKGSVFTLYIPIHKVKP